ncbi:LytR/AlgR family response regulator transcription factor [Arcticibacter sp.]|uniref:LytR/AlgR family response regulator transcription factor n=1 Tax=Arcticibacter sp. TaxID=1872630 RepID=UPI00388D6FB3
MKKISVVIADADHEQRRRTSKILRCSPSFFLAGECTNGIEALKDINALEPQLLLIDVDLPGKNAWTVLESASHLPALIFIARSGIHALKAFEHNALDYILKPIRKERLHQALDKYIKWHDLKIDNGNLEISINKSELPNRILVENGRRLESISLNNVTYFKADRDYTWIYTDNNDAYLSSLGISSIERKLDKNRFIRIHRSYIINIEHIKTLHREITRLFVTLPNQVEINVGRNYMPSIKQLIL